MHKYSIPFIKGFIDQLSKLAPKRTFSPISPSPYSTASICRNDYSATLPVLVVTAYSCLLGSQFRAHSGRSRVATRPEPASIDAVRTPARMEWGLRYAGFGGCDILCARLLHMHVVSMISTYNKLRYSPGPQSGGQTELSEIAGEKRVAGTTFAEDVVRLVLVFQAWRSELGTHNGASLSCRCKRQG